MKDFSLAKKIYTKNSIENLEKKIMLLGSNNKTNAVSFLNLRLITSIIIFFLSLFLFEHYGYLLAPTLTCVYYYLIYYFCIEYKIKIRTKQIENEAITFFEILTLAVESGNDLSHAIEITASNVSSELSNEFKRTIDEIKYSKTLTEALKSMRARIPSDNVNNIILNISEASMFGGNIIDTLHNQIDFLNEKRVQYIRGEINKLPMKISIMSVIFFIPLILLLILSPVLINLFY